MDRFRRFFCLQLNLLNMHWPDQIRNWQRLALCGLLSMVVCGLTGAQTQTDATAPSAKPPQTSTTPTVKPQPPEAGDTTAKHASTKKTSTHKTVHPSSHTSTQKSKSAHGKTSSTKRGQQAIDSARAREIQTALIREHYMQGEPSGAWDSTTQAAMQRYQAAQGWQSKTTPDARALIKLGLGPSHDHLLNPESAMTSTPGNSDPKANAKQTPPENDLPKQ